MISWHCPKFNFNPATRFHDCIHYNLLFGRNPCDANEDTIKMLKWEPVLLMLFLLWFYQILVPSFWSCLCVFYSYSLLKIQFQSSIPHSGVLAADLPLVLFLEWWFERPVYSPPDALNTIDAWTSIEVGFQWSSVLACYMHFAIIMNKDISIE